MFGGVICCCWQSSAQMKQTTCSGRVCVCCKIFRHDHSRTFTPYPIPEQFPHPNHLLPLHFQTRNQLSLFFLFSPTLSLSRRPPSASPLHHVIARHHIPSFLTRPSPVTRPTVALCRKHTTSRRWGSQRFRKSALRNLFSSSQHKIVSGEL